MNELHALSLYKPLLLNVLCTFFAAFEVPSPTSSTNISFPVYTPCIKSSKAPGARLEDKIAKMKRDFEELVDCVEKYFVENVHLEKVQNSIKHIDVSLKRDLGKYFRKESLEAESIKELFVTMSCYWDYLNPSLFEFLVNRFGSENDIAMLNTYLEKLKQFRSEVKLGEYVKSKQNDDNISESKIYKEITAIMGPGWEEKTLQDAENYKNELADKCHIQRLLGRINVTRSSIALVFYVPRWFEVKKEELEPFFRKQNVRKVYLDDICFIDWVGISLRTLFYCMQVLFCVPLCLAGTIILAECGSLLFRLTRITEFKNTLSRSN